MILTCEGCQTRFRVPDEKISDKDVRARCSRCGLVFSVRKTGDRIEVVRSETRQQLAKSPTPGPAAAPVRAAPSPPPARPRDEDDPFSHLQLAKIPLEPAPRPADPSRKELAGSLLEGSEPLLPLAGPAAPAMRPPSAPAPSRRAETAASSRTRTDSDESTCKTRPVEPPPLLGGPTAGSNGLDMSGAIDLGAEEGAGLELETFAPSSGRAPSLRTRLPERRASPARVLPVVDPEASGGQEGRMVSFGEESEGAEHDPAPGGMKQPRRGAGPASSSTGPSLQLADIEPKWGLSDARGSTSRPVTLPPGTALDRPRSTTAEIALGRTDTSLPRVVTTPPLVSQTVPVQVLQPSLGVTALTALATLLLLLLGVTVLALVRNGWVLDLRRPAQLLAVTLGRAAPALQVADGPARLVDLRQVLYPTSSGKDLLLVEGEVQNEGSRSLKSLRLAVRLLDRSRRVLEERQVEPGSLLEPAQLLAVDGEAALDRAYLEAQRRSERPVLQPGGRTPFMAVFLHVPEGRAADELAIEARVVDLREAADGGS